MSVLGSERFCATFFDTVLDDNALADGLQQTVGTSDQAWSSRGTRKSKGSRTNTGHIKTRATDVKLANPTNTGAQ